MARIYFDSVHVHSIFVAPPISPHTRTVATISYSGLHDADADPAINSGPRAWSMLWLTSPFFSAGPKRAQRIKAQVIRALARMDLQCVAPCMIIYMEMQG